MVNHRKFLVSLKYKLQFWVLFILSITLFFFQNYFIINAFINVRLKQANELFFLLIYLFPSIYLFFYLVRLRFGFLILTILNCQPCGGMQYLTNVYCLVSLNMVRNSTSFLYLLSFIYYK